MRTICRKMYAAVSATANAAATLEITRAGTLYAATFNLTPTASGATGYGKVAVDSQSTGVWTTSDILTTVLQASIGWVFSTSGIQAQVNHHIGGLAIGLAQGDRLYLNALVAGTIQFTADVVLYIAER